MTKLIHIAAILLGSILLTSCLKTYKHDVQQGNIVDPNRLARLEIGMTQSDVQSLLGTAMIKDSFHPNRWDYFYSLRKARQKETEKRSLTLFFEDGRLAEIRGEISEPEEGTSTQTRTVIIDQRPEQGGMIQRGWDKVTK